MATQRPTSAGAALTDRQVNFGKAHVRYFSKDSPCNPPARTSSSEAEAAPTTAKERPRILRRTSSAESLVNPIMRRTSSAESLVNPIMRRTSSASPPARDTMLARKATPAHSQSARSIKELQRASPATGTRASAHSATRPPLPVSDSQLSLAGTECGSPDGLVRASNASKASARHQTTAARDEEANLYLELDTIPRSSSFECLDALDLGVSPESSPRDNVAQRRLGMLRHVSATF
jgi:hypothetical protein|eukprot:Tamp_19496.p1 GENE.Tamp_19496~~Tamp_19496.p1  ORF type:complete len:235 (+),score=24.01 Tamp_19496:26-730(+)